MDMVRIILFLVKVIFFFSCSSMEDIESYIHDVEPISISGNINVVIEIPSGTHDKFEVSKETGQIVQDIEDGLPRKIKYIGYPGNYGMSPKTLLSLFCVIDTVLLSPVILPALDRSVPIIKLLLPSCVISKSKPPPL